MTNRRATARHVSPRPAIRRVLLPLAAALAIVATTAPTAGANAGAGAPTAGTATAPLAPTGEIRPTIQYEEALAHAEDRIAFAPGERVEVPFTPRRSDRWAVGGVAPRSLPAGRLTGKAIREAAAPPASAVAPPSDPSVALPSDAAGADPGAGAPGVDPAGAAGAGAAGADPAGATTAGPDPADADATGADPTAGPPSGPVDAPVVDPAAAIDAHLAAAVDPGGLRREVFGFLPYWELTDSSTRLDWEALSTIAYFGVGAAANGDLQRKNSDGSTTVGWSGWTSSKMTNVINAAHANGTRVVLTVQSFAWTSSQVTRQKALLGSSTARANLARQVAAAVRDRGADGVNLDFEPIVSGYADEFTTLVKAIRTELNRVARGYQITFDTTGWIGNYPIENATGSAAADAVVIMGYDYRTAGTAQVGSVAPIGGPTYDIGDTIRAYVSRLPASRVILAVPYYGRAWSTDTSSLNAKNISGTKYGASATVVYGTAYEYARDNGRDYDTVEGVAWTAYKRENCTATYGCVTGWRQIYYDDVRALGAKYDLVERYGLRGVGLWALGYDGTRTELYQLLKDKFITDTIPPAISASSISSPVVSPNGDGRLDTVTVNVSVTGHIRFGYLVEPFFDSTAGTPVRSGTVDGKAVTYTWDGRTADGSALPDGPYRITVWTADASDNRASVQKVVTIDTKPPVIGSSASPASISPNGDGRADSTSLRMSSDATITGKARVIGPSGATVRVWTITPGSAGSWTWNGRNTSGAVVADTRYTFRVDGYDAAGNHAVRDTPVLVDRTIRSLGWTVSRFKPSTGGSSRVVFTLARRATATVAIYRGSTLVRTIWANRALSAGTYRWTWNGRTAAGARVAPGTYRAVLTATSWIGPSTATRTVTVVAP